MQLQSSINPDVITVIDQPRSIQPCLAESTLVGRYQTRVQASFLVTVQVLVKQSIPSAARPLT